MPITSFTIGGVEVDPLLSGFEIRETEGGISTLVCDIDSSGSPVQRFFTHQEIIVQEDGVRIFAGTITQTRERGFGGPNLYEPTIPDAPEIVTGITAEDFTSYADRVFVTESVAEGTLLKTFLTTLVTNYLSVLGVTLHTSQVNGPALPAMEFVRERGSSVLQKLAEVTGFLNRIDYDEALRMWAPGELQAPFDIDEDDDPARWSGDVEVENILGDEFANQVTVIVGPLVEQNRVESFDGDGVTDTFTLTYTPTRLPQVIHIFQLDGVTPAGGETFSTQPPISPVQWEYDATTNQIIRVIGATEDDKIYRLTFDGVLTLEGFAEDAASVAAIGPYPVQIQRDDILTQEGADDAAAALLAQLLEAGEQKAVYDTRFTAPTLRAGQEQAITSPLRTLSGNYIITNLSVRAETPVTATFAADGLGLIRKVEVKKQNTGRWQQTWHDYLLGGRSSVSVGSATNPQTSSGPAPPFTSVQFNRDGVFGGDAEFTYDEDTDSVVCGGGGSSITAADPVSCQVFGYNNHIADP